jgi:phosphoserine phosphatase RsbU/P
VGDAAGHGIKACMSIMTMRTLIHMIRSQRYHNTAEFVTEVNKRLVNEDIIHGEGGFITLLYCALDTLTRELQWTSAGHPMPMLQDLTINEIRSLAGGDQAGMPLGIDPDEKYESYTIKLPENSRLLLYSDGLADAFPAQSDEYVQFGEQGIMNCLKASKDCPLDDSLDKLFVDSHAFTRGEGRHDDTSAVLVEHREGN